MVKPKAEVNAKICLACGGCISICPKDAIVMISNKAVIDKNECNSCEICIKTCPVAAISLEGN